MDDDALTRHDEDDPGPGPIRGGLDELLDVVPETAHHRGRFEGYNAGSRVRRTIVAVSIAFGIVCAWGYSQIEAKREFERLHPWDYPAGTDTSDRPREINWTSGFARLGLSREPPAAEVIHLPDRDIRLAEGCDHAQLKVEVQDGMTIELTVLTGDVVQTPANNASP